MHKVLASIRARRVVSLAAPRAAFFAAPVAAPHVAPRAAPLALALTTTLLSACVTINIYFPAAAAEKAADRIIDEIYQSRKDAAGAVPVPPATAPVPTTKPADTK